MNAELTVIDYLFLIYIFFAFTANILRWMRIGVFLPLLNPLSIFFDFCEIFSSLFGTRRALFSYKNIGIWFSQEFVQKTAEAMKINISTFIADDVLMRSAHQSIINIHKSSKFKYGPTTIYVIEECLAIYIKVVVERQKELHEKLKKREEQIRKEKAHRERFSEGTSKGSGPSHAKPSKENWRSILGLSDREKDPKVIQLAYRKMAMKYHPDRGGSQDQMASINVAITMAKNELKF